MKIFRIIRIMSAFLILIGVSSCDKEDDPTIPEIKLSKNELTLELGQGEKVFLSGGDGTYTLTPGESPIAEVILKDKTLEITARKTGSQVFTINSANKKAVLRLTVKDKPIPHLSSVGIYGKDNEILFSYSMTAKTKKGIWLCEKSQNPYSKRVFLSYYTEEANELLVIAEGLSPAIENTGDQGKKFPIVKEKDLEGGKVQLVSGNLRFIVEKK